ncbi:MAG TPA: hypothetical protein VGD10_13290 [Allosphingosinicella sp.]|uniref:hypothetical protein n=1 Tax=Allosphingosinicella sp. TaxID=2823234 RepID=UPI002ED92EA0
MDERLAPIERLREKIGSYPELRFEEGVEDGQRWLRIEATDEGGFPITLSDEVDEWTVYYGDGGGHLHFDEGQEALEYVAFGLSEECRLVETWRGDLLQKSKLERWDGEKWRALSVYGVFRWPFWRTKRVVVRQNRFIKAESVPRS